MAKRSNRPDWERLERARRSADRADFEATTPGQRVEQQLVLSRELTRLAARRARAR